MKNFITKQDIYERVTTQIIALLEQGVAPWESNCLASAGWPRNFSTGKAYRGINVFLLASRNYSSPWFMTYKQAEERGGFVRKGEKGSLIIKYGTYTKEEPGAEKQEAGSEATPGVTRGFLKGFTVFNACQIEGIEFPETPAADLPLPPACETAEEIIRSMPLPPVIHEGRTTHPHYVPALDIVEMPARGSFTSQEAFFKTLFHEVTHSTGHLNRLARKTLLENKGMAAIGDDRKTYCLEELVAEMGAAFLSAHAGIVTDSHQQSASYLNGWLSVLKVTANRRWIVQAASEAQKAADYVLGMKC